MSLATLTAEMLAIFQTAGQTDSQVAAAFAVAVLKSGVPPGKVSEWAGATAPDYWLLCDGAAVSRTTYADLFAIIGTTWGVGNGSTTFNLPDFREAAPVGAGTYSAVTGTTHGAIAAHDAAALAAFKDDQAQGHYHRGIGKYNGVAGSAANFERGVVLSPAAGTGTGDDNAANLYARAMVTDGVNGTPRAGSVTRGKIIGINFIIKT